jgi:hypothetical protein
MKKLHKIKEFIIKNNIHSSFGSYVDDDYIFCIFPDVYDFKNWHKIIVCKKKSNTTYLIDIDTKKYQKIGDFKKGEDLADELSLYYNGQKYSDIEKTHFVEYQKNKTNLDNPHSNIPIKENIKKYYNFWKQIYYEYPEYADKTITRFELKEQRQLKLNKIEKNGGK